MASSRTLNNQRQALVYQVIGLSFLAEEEIKRRKLQEDIPNLINKIYRNEKDFTKISKDNILFHKTDAKHAKDIISTEAVVISFPMEGGRIPGGGLLRG